MRPLRSGLLSALAAFLPLAAQHFEEGRLFLPIHQYPEGKGAGNIGHGETRMAVMEAGGRQTLLDLPLPLQGRRGICKEVAHHQGTHYALGMLNHPLFDRVGDHYFEQTQSNRSHRLPHVLYKRVGQGPWQELARLTPAQVRVGFRTFLPLDGDRFLVQTMFPALEVQGRKVSFLLLAPDGRGGMIQEPVPGLAGLGEEALRKAIPVRLADRILLLQATPAGESLALDFQGQRLAMASHALKGDLAAAAPRPDGRILLQRGTGDDFNPSATAPRVHWLLEQFQPRSPQSKLLATWAMDRAPQEATPRKRATWAVLDPATGALYPVPPPQGVDRQVRAGRVRWAVLPDGNLYWHSEMPMRAYGAPRLLDTFQLPLPPRKAQP